MLYKLFNIHGPNEVLDLEDLEKILQTHLREVEPRSGYEGSLRRRLSDYSYTQPVVFSGSRTRYMPTTNEALLMMIGVLSGAVVLVMGIRVAVITIAGLELMRNMKREIQARHLQSPRAVG